MDPGTAEIVRRIGQWGRLFGLENVAAHVSMLPTGKIIYWGRRANPDDTTNASLNEHFTRAFLLDPSTKVSTPAAAERESPKQFDSGNEVNLFCSGHSLLPDGKLLVVGGHIKDGHGVNQACVYDPVADTWTSKKLMSDGRWYPSARTLPDGSVLVVSGAMSDGTDYQPNPSSQIWRGEDWVRVSDLETQLPLYPRFHLDPNGRVFMAGPLKSSYFLEWNVASGDAFWTNATSQLERTAGHREYAASVQYDKGKIIYISGGNDIQEPQRDESGPPTKMTEIIDLNDPSPKWVQTADITFARQQHNATVLPDGTVLVNGGTGGPGFNNLGVDQTTQRPYPVHVAELWDPNAGSNGKWNLMAEESVDRCYHSIALLLPDGQVLSAGGGEYPGPGLGMKDTHTTAQLFKPPYLFKDPQTGPAGVQFGRPSILFAPVEIEYGVQFEVIVDAADTIAKASLVRLGSITHCTNMNQIFLFLLTKQQGTKVTVEGPAGPNLAPPGHYMLFLLSDKGVPAVAPIIHIASDPTKLAKPVSPPAAAAAPRMMMVAQIEPNLAQVNERVEMEQVHLALAVGLTPVCPYGLGPCWGGAHEALQRIPDVKVVQPVADQTHSIAYVHQHEDILPDIDVWRDEFQKHANGAYVMRGFEITLSGVVTKKENGAGEQLILAGTSTRPNVTLGPFRESSNIQWDMTMQKPRPITQKEAGGYAQLSGWSDSHTNGASVQVTGRLHKHGNNKFSLDVRSFEGADHPTSHN